MSKITEISVQKNDKNRCNLYLDGKFFSGLSIELAYKYALKVGVEIDDDTMQEIIIQSERSDSLNKALNYVSKTIKTKRQVKDYLLKKGFDASIANECVNKLIEYGYIDDKEYSKRFIESTAKSQGERLIEYKLMSKGVCKDDIAYGNDNAEIDYFSCARALCEKYLKNKEKTKENVYKAYRYLLSRGYNYEQAEFAIKDFKEDF